MRRTATRASCMTPAVFGYSPPATGGDNDFPKAPTVATEIGDNALFVDQAVFSRENQKPRRKMMGDERIKARNSATSKEKMAMASKSNPSGEAIVQAQGTNPRANDATKDPLGADATTAALAGYSTTSTARTKNEARPRPAAAPAIKYGAPTLSGLELHSSQQSSTKKQEQRAAILAELQKWCDQWSCHGGSRGPKIMHPGEDSECLTGYPQEFPEVGGKKYPKKRPKEFRQCTFARDSGQHEKNENCVTKSVKKANKDTTV